MKTTVTRISSLVLLPFVIGILILVLGLALWTVSAGFVVMEAIAGNSAGEAFWGHLCHVGLIPLQFILHLPY